MYFLLHGPDTFRSRKKLAALRERFSATRDATGLNLATFRHGAETAEQAAEAIFASPFLAERKMVVIEGFLKAAADDQEMIGNALHRKPDSTVVIVFEPHDAATLEKSPLFADLKAKQYSEEFPALMPGAAERFATDEATAAGAKLEARAARKLVELAGTDSWMLHTAVARLAAYALAAKSGAITEKDVEGQTKDGREAEIFAFIDSCAEGRSKEASKQLQQLLAGDASELQVVALLLKHYRAALAARDLQDRGGPASADELARQLGMHPFPAGKALAFARRHGRDGLARAYEKLVQMEKAAKSGGPSTKTRLAAFVSGPEK